LPFLALLPPGIVETLEVTAATTIKSTGNLKFGNARILKFDGGVTVAGSLSLTGAKATIMGNCTLNSGSSVNLNGGSTLGI